MPSISCLRSLRSQRFSMGRTTSSINDRTRLRISSSSGERLKSMAMRAVSCRLDRLVKAGFDRRCCRGVGAAVARRGELVVEDVAEPVLGPGDALVAVKACGICGSDLHALHYADELVAITREMGVPIAFDPARDFIMGHEFTGEVLELGPMTDGSPVKPGDLVTSLPIALTPTGMEPVGAYSNTYNGAYADRMRLTAGLCMKLPNGLDHRRAALTEPMAVGRHAVARAAVTPPEAAGVLGARPACRAVLAE